jgi:hypothetical protein
MPVATGITGDAGVRTVLATLDMPAERGSATDLNCRHDASLGEIHMTSAGGAPRLAMTTEDVR